METEEPSTMIVREGWESSYPTCPEHGDWCDNCSIDREANG